jgi:hypothetical protein
MKFKDLLNRYKDNNLEALTHETSYYHKRRGTIYQKRREYFINKKADLEKKLKNWGLGIMYEYTGQKTWRISDEIITDSFKYITTEEDMDEVEAFIEWKTNSTVVRIKRRITKIGIIRS